MIIAGYSIDRGRSYELDKTGAGTASVTMIDTTGELDPTNPAYDFDPMTPAALAIRNPVLGTDHTIFRGYVSRLDYDLYQNERYGVAMLDLVDGMDLLEAVEMTDQKFGEPPGAGGGDIIFGAPPQVGLRIGTILDQCLFPSGLREIFSGNVKIRQTVYAPRTSALAAIQDAADAEFPGVASNFYFQKDGRATFHGRLARFNPADANYHISTWRCGDTAAVQADSTRALIFELAFDRDKDKVINSVLSTPQEITDAQYAGQLVEDAASIAQYGTRSMSFENLLTIGDYFGASTPLTATKKFATWYVANFAQPRNRINKITFKSRVGDVSSYSDRLWRLICNVDISDIIRLKTTHHGGAGGFDEDFFVEGLHYTVEPLSPTFDDVTLTLDVSPRTYYNTAI